MYLYRKSHRKYREQYCIIVKLNCLYECLQERRYIRLELREMYQMLIKDDLVPDITEAKEVYAQLDALYELLSDKPKKKVKNEFANF